MEQVPTTSPAKDMQPVRLPNTGYLDDVFSIFKARQHPVVLVEESAIRWMGVRVSPEEVNITSPSPAASRCLTLTNSGFRLIDQRLRNRSHQSRSSRNRPVRTRQAEPRPTILRYLHTTSSSTTTQPTAIAHITASAFGSSASTCSTSTARILKSPDRTPGM